MDSLIVRKIKLFILFKKNLFEFRIITEANLESDDVMSPRQGAHYSEVSPVILYNNIKLTKKQIITIRTTKLTLNIDQNDE